MEKPAYAQFPIHELVARVELKIPSGFEPVAMIAVGYPGDPAVLPERLPERELRPRSRRPIGESTFVGQWGNPIA